MFLNFFPFWQEGKLGSFLILFSQGNIYPWEGKIRAITLFQCLNCFGGKNNLLGKEENQVAQFLSQGELGGHLVVRKRKERLWKKKGCVTWVEYNWWPPNGVPWEGENKWPFGCNTHTHNKFIKKKVVSFGSKKTRWPPCCVPWEGENQVTIPRK